MWEKEERKKMGDLRGRGKKGGEKRKKAVGDLKERGKKGGIYRVPGLCFFIYFTFPVGG